MIDKYRLDRYFESRKICAERNMLKSYFFFFLGGGGGGGRGGVVEKGKRL